MATLMQALLASRWLLPALGIVTLAACSQQAPPCPFNGVADTAPSAGCFNTSRDGLLVVEGLRGQVSLPGGASQAGESARCTAFRETWEETGLRLQPRELLAVLETGFHLYRCDRTASSGQIDPPPRLEVRRAFYLHREEFDQHTWRYALQRDRLKAMLSGAD
jgi:ADP-ribose pyrophosphatase YjhB (NUDIX family)